jgi:hypothetical protein
MIERDVWAHIYRWDPFQHYRVLLQTVMYNGCNKYNVNRSSVARKLV